MQLCTIEHGQEVDFLLIHMSTPSGFLETKFSCHLTKLTAISTSAYQAAYASLNYRILDLFDFDSKMFGSKGLETWWSLVSSLQLQSNYRSPCRLQVHPFRPLGEFPSGKIPSYVFVFFLDFLCFLLGVGHTLQPVVPLRLLAIWHVLTGTEKKRLLLYADPDTWLECKGSGLDTGHRTQEHNFLHCN